MNGVVRLREKKTSTEGSQSIEIIEKKSGERGETEKLPSLEVAALLRDVKGRREDADEGKERSRADRADRGGRKGTVSRIDPAVRKNGLLDGVLDCEERSGSRSARSGDQHLPAPGIVSGGSEVQHVVDGDCHQ